jgi:hypothetical protein
MFNDNDCYLALCYIFNPILSNKKKGSFDPFKIGNTLPDYCSWVPFGPSGGKRGGFGHRCVLSIYPRRLLVFFRLIYEYINILY